MIDKFTYGNTPAAIYLAEYLNSAGTPPLLRKVTRTLTDFFELINELEAANAAGVMSAHSVGSFCHSLRARAQAVKFEDTLVTNLVCNLMIGRTKELIRRVQSVRLYEKVQAHRKQGLSTLPLVAITDTTTPELLVERSKRRLARNQKLDTLY